MEAGDILYLPPGVSHHGVAKGESLTFSIGYRAPDYNSLALDFAGLLAEEKEMEFYTDPDLTLQTNPGELDKKSVEKIKAKMLEKIERVDFNDWFATYITQPKWNISVEEREEPASLDEFKKLLSEHKILKRDPSTSALFYNNGRDLFMNGEKIEVPSGCEGLAVKVSNQRTIELSDFDDELQEVFLLKLYNRGHLYF
jgi:50S ribosomal protein L16 3-hydroxylase